MSTLIHGQELAKTHGERTLFQELSLTIEPGDRLGVIGPNGSGKSTLLRVIAGLEPPDQGERTTKKHLKCALVPQETVFPPDNSIQTVIDEALEEAAQEGWEEVVDLEVHAGIALSKLGFLDPQKNVGELSGGWQRRLSIARALAVNPEVILLDEPTNHLDLEGILWLEKLLARSPLAWVVVTHDRAFLQAVATELLELDPR